MLIQWANTIVIHSDSIVCFKKREVVFVPAKRRKDMYSNLSSQLYIM